MNGAHYVTETALDWDRFVARHWDRHPVVFRGIGDPVYPSAAVLRAAARARPSAGVQTPVLRFVLDGRQLAQADGWLPEAGDGDFDAYARRVRRQAGADCEYALIVNTLHGHGYGVWDAGRRFFRDLWARVGVPGSSAITTLFHGNYERTPVGVHKDRFATFLFVLQGRKRMRFWPRRPWSEPVATRVDYAQYLDASFAIDVAPGDVLYWPADYYHVGETAGAGQATSVNVGIPRHEHRLAYDLEALASLAPPARSSAPRPSPAPMFAAPDAVLPDAMSHALAAVRAELDGDRLAAGALAWLLQLQTGGGFAPPPPLAGISMPGNQALLRLRDARAPVIWARLPGGEGALCATGGHVRRVEERRDWIEALVDRLNGGDAVAVADEPAFLRWLLATRAVVRVE